MAKKKELSIFDTLVKKYGEDVVKSGKEVFEEISNRQIISVSPCLDYALGGGMVKGSYSELANLIDVWLDYLKQRHPEFNNGSSYFNEYSNDKGGDWYLSKLSKVELVSQRGIGLDSVGNSNWKMSTELKERIKAKNENAAVNY